MTKTRRQRESEALELEHESEPTNALKSVALAAASWVVSLPRLVRVVVIATFALAWTLLIFPLVDQIYFYYFFDMSTRGLPAYVIAAIGLLIYFIGWYLLVGTVGNRPAPKVASGIYVLLGIAVLLLDIILIIYGFIIQAQA